MTYNFVLFIMFLFLSVLLMHYIYVIFIPLASQKLARHIAFESFIRPSRFSCEQGILITFKLGPLNLVNLLGLWSRLPDEILKK